MRTNIHFINNDKKVEQHDFVTKALVRQILKQICNSLGLFGKTKSLDITILFASMDLISELNRDFLKKDYPTNILSFPDRDLNYLSLTENDFVGEIELGDIALSFEVIRKEANEYGTTVQNHFTHLLVHAILHLIGYDHILDEDYITMKELEIKILNNLGLETPRIYAEKEEF